MASVVCMVAAVVVVLGVLAGMLCMARHRGPVDRILALQLGGSMGIAGMLLTGTALGATGVEDLALTAALLAAITTITYVRSAGYGGGGES